MADANSRRSSGQPFKAPPANTWNDMVAAGEAYRDGYFSQGRPERLQPLPTDIIKVRNDTGADRNRGEAVCFDGFVLTDFEPYSFWLKGVATTRGRLFAVLKEPVQEDGVALAQISGCCLGRVNVTNLTHRAARIPDDGTHVLESSFSGPIDLLWTPEETGIADCAINIRRDSLPVFKTPVGGIAGRDGTTCSSAECTAFYLDNDGELVELLDHEDESQSVEVFSYVTEDVAAETYITAKDVFGVLVVDSEDCG